MCFSLHCAAAPNFRHLGGGGGGARGGGVGVGGGEGGKKVVGGFHFRQPGKISVIRGRDQLQENELAF